MNITNVVESIRTQSEQFLLTSAKLYKFSHRTTEKGQNINHYDAPVDIKVRVINRGGNDEMPVASQYRAVQQVVNTSTIRMQVPYTLDVTLDDYIVVDDQKFDIVHIPVRHELSGSFVIYLQKRT